MSSGTLHALIPAIHRMMNWHRGRCLSSHMPWWTQVYFWVCGGTGWEHAFVSLPATAVSGFAAMPAPRCRGSDRSAHVVGRRVTLGAAPPVQVPHAPAALHRVCQIPSRLLNPVSGGSARRLHGANDPRGAGRSASTQTSPSSTASSSSVPPPRCARARRPTRERRRRARRGSAPAAAGRGSRLEFPRRMADAPRSAPPWRRRDAAPESRGGGG
jgi:hypothetical protein